MLSETMPYEKKSARVNGKKIAYVEEGSGDPIVLLHGNPTSSFLWRNVVPELMESGRVIVPDLIGQGDSEKLPASEGAIRYSLEVAYNYVDGLLQTIGADKNVTLVIHDWGSALGFARGAAVLAPAWWGGACRLCALRMASKAGGRGMWGGAGRVGVRALTARDNRGAAKGQPRGKVRQRAATIRGGGEHGAEAFVEVAPLREAVDHLIKGG